MAEVIRMPLLSDTMTEGKIVAWNKKVGDKVKSDDVVAEVEPDKATMEVNGDVDGTLLYIGVPEGKADWRRATRILVGMRTSMPSYNSPFGLVGRCRNVFVVPVMNAGSGLPELTLRTTMSLVP